MRRGPDRKSEFLRALKDEGTGELTTSSSPGTSGEVGGSLTLNFIKRHTQNNAVLTGGDKDEMLHLVHESLNIFLGVFVFSFQQVHCKLQRNK